MHKTCTHHAARSSTNEQCRYALMCVLLQQGGETNLCCVFCRLDGPCHLPTWTPAMCRLCELCSPMFPQLLNSLARNSNSSNARIRRLTLVLGVGDPLPRYQAFLHSRTAIQASKRHVKHTTQRVASREERRCGRPTARGHLSLEETKFEEAVVISKGLYERGVSRRT